MIHVIYFDVTMPEVKLQSWFDSASEVREFARKSSVKVVEVTLIEQS